MLKWIKVRQEFIKQYHDNPSNCSSSTLSRNEYLENSDYGKDREVSPVANNEDQKRDKFYTGFNRKMNHSGQEISMAATATHSNFSESCARKSNFQAAVTNSGSDFFESILFRLFCYITNRESEIANGTSFINHQQCSMSLVEQSVCGACGATSEPLTLTQMVNHVSASTLIRQKGHCFASKQNNLFGQFLRHAGEMEDIRDCPNLCGAKIQIRRTLINRPEIISVGIVWDSVNPSLESVIDIFTKISTSLRVEDVFHSVVDSTWSSSLVHHLVGLVTFCGTQYYMYFFQTKLKMWMCFDNVSIKEVGVSWDIVVERCRNDRHQPLLLIYCTFQNIHLNIGNSFSMAKAAVSVEKRSTTPSPEKNYSYNTSRRAVTPNPASVSNSPYLPKRMHNEYQNLKEMQRNIFFDKREEMNNFRTNIDADYYIHPSMETAIHNRKKQVNLTRSLSTGSAPHNVLNIPDHLNVPRRRDSGNWSGDRNSASSSSSTTMDNPYQYIISRMQKSNHLLKGSVGSYNEAVNRRSSNDAGYDSYSLSSTDSLPLQQNLRHNLQLAQIPEFNQQTIVADCEQLCSETDKLMEKSRAAENAGDLNRAIAFCSAASIKAREAMNAPYSNSHNVTFAQMKHNTCVMRMRNLQKKVSQENDVGNREKLDTAVEGRHSRESSKLSQHSRQSSRDKSDHSRQNSQEMITSAGISLDIPAKKSIEIYATLPKKKTARSKTKLMDTTEDEEYMLYESGMQKSSFFTRSRRRQDNKVRENKRTRSEERSRNTSKDLPVTTTQTCNKNHSKKEDIAIYEDNKQGKKQHKIRRKLLMGGLIKRKNRSMPDLRDNQDNAAAQNSLIKNSNSRKQSVDDIEINAKCSEANLSGYLSEGHLEYNDKSKKSYGNPNLERSKFMRKSFHGAATKVLHVAKVPPPPPIRTTSQLSKSKLSNMCAKEVNETTKKIKNNHDNEDISPWNSQLPKHQEDSINSNSIGHQVTRYNKVTQDSYNYHNGSNSNNYNNHVLQDIPSNIPRVQDDAIQYANGMLCSNQNFVTTKADIHNERKNVVISCAKDSSTFCVENNISHSRQSSEDFPPPPPYPVITSVSHSRQGSEEFPPPPTFLTTNNDSSYSDQGYQLSKQNNDQKINNFLAQLQKRKQNSDIEHTECIKQEIVTKGENSEEQFNSPKRMTVNGIEAALYEKNFASNISKTRDSSKDYYAIQSRKEIDCTLNGLSDDRDEVDNVQIAQSSVKDMAAKYEQQLDQDIKFQNKTITLNFSPNVDKGTKLENDKIKFQENVITNDNCNNAPHLTNNIAAKNNYSQNRNSRNSSIFVDPYSTTLNNTLSRLELTSPHENGLPVEDSDPDITEIALQNTIQNTTILPNENDIFIQKVKRIGKKKSVSFCDQVVLVATAEDDEQDSYIPNPILERVLRSAVNKVESAKIIQEIANARKMEHNAAIKFQQHTLPLMVDSSNSIQMPLQDQIQDSQMEGKFKVNNNNMRRADSGTYGVCITDSEDMKKQCLNDSDMFLGMSKIELKSQEQINYQQTYNASSNENGGYLHKQINYVEGEFNHQREFYIQSNNKNTMQYSRSSSLEYPKSNEQRNINNIYYYPNNYERDQYYGVANMQFTNQQSQQINIPKNQQLSCNPQSSMKSSKNRVNSLQPLSSLTQQQIDQSMLAFQAPLNSNKNFISQQNTSYQNVSNSYQQKAENNKKFSKDLEILMENNVHRNGQYAIKLTPEKSSSKIHINQANENGFIVTNQSANHLQQQQGGFRNKLKCDSVDEDFLKMVLCNLCHKKQVSKPELFCPDCEFYMSRFKAKSK